MRWVLHRPIKSIFQAGMCVVLLESLAFAAPINLSQEIENKEEAFLVRRIAEFWKDQDYKIVKGQVIEFLETFPKSRINDHLRGILGDIYLQETAYEKALQVYSQIKSNAIIEKIAINKLQCLYELDRFGEIIQFGSQFATKIPDDFENRLDEYHFLMGEGYFRSAAQMEEGAKRLDYLSKAEPFYEKVIQSSFSDSSMFALAEIYRLRKENEKAAKYFAELSERHPDQKEELLFHAGLAQAEFDKPQAIETFTKIVAKGGLKSQDAALNRLILFFQKEQYEDVIDSYSVVLKDLDEQKAPTLSYIIGRSYFAQEDYENASTWLKKYISTNQDASSELRNALLMQLNCAQNLHSETLYDESVAQLVTLFPQDKELPQAEFIHAMMLKEKQDFEGAEKKLAKLIRNHPNFEDLETLYLEFALVTYSSDQWEKSYKALNQFLQKFPNSEHSDIAWKYLLSSSLNLLKSSESGASVAYSKKDFLKDLTAVLARSEILTPNEKRECLFLQGKMAYELEHFSDSLTYLNKYLELYPKDATAPEAHLLVALCHHKLNGQPEKFCKHAEAALKGNPELESKSSIHLELYNVYLSLIEKSEKTGSTTETIQSLYRNAADHLYTAMQLQDLPIKLENRLWLGNYYYNEAVRAPELYELDGSLPKDENKAMYNRSLSLLEGVVRDEGAQLITLSANTAYLEWEALKIANLYGRSGEFDKKLSVLRNLAEQQSKNPSWDWKLRKETLLEIAKTYDLIGKKEEAFETYDFIASQYAKKPSFVSEYSYLQSLKIKFDLMDSSMKIDSNDQVFSILNDLKELQIRKAVASEPIHLEAALEYAWIRARTSSFNEQPERYQFFLNRIKEDYENATDPMVVTYQSELKYNDTKNDLYNAYMLFVEAEIARCEAVAAMKENRTAQALEAGARSKELLLSISDSSQSLYLHQRIKKSLGLLEKAKIA